MDLMSERMESAYSKLYKWTKNECRSLESDTPESSQILITALNSLQDRPVLLM